MLREIDERTGDNLRVTMYWNEHDGTLVVEVEDLKHPERDVTLTDIPAADARMAFLHPFTYETPREEIAA